MDIAATKLELMQHLMSISDEKTLKRVAVFFKKEVPKAVEEEDDITDEEYAAFDEEIAKCERGEIKFHTEEESLRLIRSAGKTKA
jgi:hypothetical protein